MSLMALILICAAPALVSVIDDSDSYNYTTVGEVTSDNIGFAGFWSNDIPPDTDKTFVGLLDDNKVTATLTEPTSAEYLDQYRIQNLNTDIFDNLTKFLIVLDTDVDDRYPVKIVSGGQTYYFTQVDDTNVWEFSPSTIDKLKITSNESFVIVVWPAEKTSYIEMELIPYITGATIAYGEIIVGATGALLIVCAILATPWVGTTGLTVKRRRSA